MKGKFTEIDFFFSPRVKRPVRCMLDRDEDMLVTGGRHPFFGRYKVRCFYYISSDIEL